MGTYIVLFLDYFLGNRLDGSANLAKERLKIIIAHERANRNGPDFLPKMRQEIMDVVSKYVNIEQGRVEMRLDSRGDCEVLELNVILAGRASEQVN